MDQSDPREGSSQLAVKTKNNLESPLECAVCLQTCVHPVQLECKHIFCFLCVKGVANQSKKCPMCRREIPPSYLEHPELVQGPLELALASEAIPKDVPKEDADTETNSTEDFRWFYEGRNGWWEYDFRTRQELEQYYQSESKTCEMLIAGFLYIIDFENSIQYRRNEPNRRRRIKRDLLSNIDHWKGVAGLRLLTSQSATGSDNSTPDNSAIDQLSAAVGSMQLSVSAADGVDGDHVTGDHSPVGADGGVPIDDNIANVRQISDDQQVQGIPSDT